MNEDKKSTYLILLVISFISVFLQRITTSQHIRNDVDFAGLIGTVLFFWGVSSFIAKYWTVKAGYIAFIVLSVLSWFGT